MFGRSALKHRKAQSAMEYLMTYGWAILIIAIVLAVLFSFGVFNSANFAPRAQPGSCEVLKNSAQTSLAGQCSGLLPEYVSYSTGQTVTVNKEYFQNQSFTILAWVYWPYGVNLANPGTSNGDLGYAWSGPSTGDNGFGIFSRDDHWYFNFYGDDLECTDGPANGQWYLFGASWNNVTKNQTIWVNGALNCTRTSNGYLVTNEPLYLLGTGASWDSVAYMNGYVSNVQLYNKSISKSQVMAVYREGIGGAPADLNSLVGWWPLNGNVNDYSGSSNDGTATNITYTSTWTSGYSAP